MSKIQTVLRRRLRSVGFDLVMFGPKRQQARFDDQEAWVQSYARALPNAPIQTGLDPAVTGIIFSKDRAMQLHALLRSYQEKVVDHAPLHVIYTASTPEHAKAYEEVFALAAPLTVKPVPEDLVGFRSRLLESLNEITASRIFFLVDDILFLRPTRLWDLAKFTGSFFIPSLRLGSNITMSQIEGRRTGDYSLVSPHMNKIAGQDLLFWRYRDGDRGWGFPLSVDGHFFLRQEMEDLLSNLAFKGPNSMEAAVQILENSYKGRFGICFQQSVIVNNPCNLVQQEAHQPVSGLMTSDQFLQLWQEGQEIDLNRYYDYPNTGFHEELPIHLRRRKTP